MDRLMAEPRCDLTLPDQVVHVWSLSLPLPDAMLQALASTLSPDEHSRARRFLFAHDRQRFIAVRGALRLLLGRYAHIPPAQVRLDYGEYGKPALAQTLPNGRRLHFSVSHAGSIALLAFNCDHELGVDVEQLRPLPNADQVARSTFSSEESAAIQALPAHQQQEAFFTCWTRKEAYVKARGLGLSFPLDQFAVTLAPDEPPRLLFVAGEPDEPSRWRFITFTPAPTYVAALVGAACEWEPQFRGDLMTWHAGR